MPDALTTREEFAALVRTDFLSFAAKAFEVLEGKPVRPGNHIEAMGRQLVAFDEGRTNRLIINAPPRSLKSFLGDVVLTAWTLGHRPGFKTIIVSHDTKLLELVGDMIRRLMQSQFYLTVFPGTRLRPDFSRRDLFQTKVGGQVMAVSLGTALTGHGADRIIIDDPIDAGDVQSAVERARVIDLFENKLITRLNSQRTGQVLVIHQRLHPNDLTGHLLDKGGFALLVIPLVAEDETTVTIDGWSWPRPAGDVFDPEQFTPQTIAELRTNSAMFVAQYQQDPRPGAAALVPHDCFGSYDDLPAGIDRCVISIDTAVKATGASYSVALVFKTNGHQHYLVDVWRDRVDYAVLEAKVLEITERYKPALAIIEDAALGSAIAAKLRGEMKGGSVRPEKPIGSKIDRLQAIMDMLHARQVLLPAYATYNQPFLEEVCSFPASTTDDQVDALSQFLKVMREVGPAWATPKIVGGVRPAPSHRHPMRDPKAPPMNFVPRGRSPYSGWRR